MIVSPFAAGAVQLKVMLVDDCASVENEVGASGTEAALAVAVSD